MTKTLTNLLKELSYTEDPAILKLVNTKLKEFGVKPIKKMATWGSDLDIEYYLPTPTPLTPFVLKTRVKLNVQYTPDYHERYNTDPAATIHLQILLINVKGNNFGYKLYQKYSLKRKAWDPPVIELLN